MAAAPALWPLLLPRLRVPIGGKHRGVLTAAPTRGKPPRGTALGFFLGFAVMLGSGLSALGTSWVGALRWGSLDGVGGGISCAPRTLVSVWGGCPYRL